MNTKLHPIGVTVPPQPTDHWLGSEHARVTLIEYADFECPSCKTAAPVPRLLLDRFPNKIRFIYRHFPLEQAHPHALLAAEAAEAAASQGQFWQMHDHLWRNQAHLQRKDLQRYAAELGLNMARYAAEMEDRIYLQKVREHIEGGRRSHIRATPAFFVDSVMQDVSFGMSVLHGAIGAAMQRTEAR